MLQNTDSFFLFAELCFWLFSPETGSGGKASTPGTVLSVARRSILLRLDVGTAEKTIKRQGFEFHVYLPSAAAPYLLFSCFADTGTSRGCSPLQPSAGAARPCTRGTARGSSLGCAAVSGTGIIYAKYPFIRVSASASTSLWVPMFIRKWLCGPV